jgi:putative transposase
MQKIGTGYTNYFNIKQKRSGALFQGKFKAVHVDSNEYLLHLSVYVNLNHFIHDSSEKNSDRVDWAYSSYAGYTH